MKLQIVFAVLCVVTVLAVGANAQTTLPTIVGVWTGTVSVVDGSGFSDTFTRLRVIEQHGALFRAFLVNQSDPVTNWITGNIQVSSSAAGGFDIGMSIVSDGGAQVVGSALLATNTTPWILKRLQALGFNGETGRKGSFTARGTLKKK
jgi:hypothetical protein